MSLYNEATGFENVNKHLVEKEYTPKDFNNFIINFFNIIEKKASNIKGLAVDRRMDYISKLAYDKEKLSKDSSNHYVFIVNMEKLFISYGNLPKKAKEFFHDVCMSAGMHKGQRIGFGVFNGNYYYKKAKDTNGDECYYAAFATNHDSGSVIGASINIYIYCLKPSANKFLECANMNKDFISSESTFDSDCDDKKIGFQGMTPEELYGTSSVLGMARDEDLSRDEDYANFFRDPKIMAHFTEHLDLTDKATRVALNTMTEADQTAILTSLTSKLYDHIVAKVDDIDYGDIPATQGDITKLPNYDKLIECVTLLTDILKEFKQDSSPVDEISKAIGNLQVRKDLFSRAFKLDCELPILMYNNTVLSIISAVSLMIATSIEFIKTPNKDSFQITLDKVAYTKTKNNMLYKNLKKFNKLCDNKELDKAMEHVIETSVKARTEGAIGGMAIAGIVAIALILSNIVPILREMVFFFYYSRMRVSDFFDIQADLLQMNAYNVQSNENLDAEQKDKIVAKQFKIVGMFRSIANKISFTGRKAEVECAKEVANADRKLKIDELGDEPETASSLF